MASASAALPENIGRLQPLAMKLFRPVFHRLWDIEVEGLENLPTNGPAIFCPNHVSVIDSFMLPAVLPKALTYVGKAEYLDDWKTARLFPALGMIPIDRRGGDHARSALDAARSVLDRGGWFGIYPEGTRSRSGKLHKGHTGAARLAVETGAPIYPVGLLGTREIQPPGQSKPNFFEKATVKIGKPVFADGARVGDRAVYRRLIDEVMFEIQGLCGQEYVNTYAGADKTADKAAAAPAVTRPQAAPTPTPHSPDAEPTIPRRSSASVLAPRPLVSAT